MVSAEDNQIISPSIVARTIEPGMVVEMSIVLHQETNFQETCPRCGHGSSNVTVASGWIEWKVSSIFCARSGLTSSYCSRRCSGQFQIAEAGQFDERINEETDEDEHMVLPASYVSLSYEIQSN